MSRVLSVSVFLRALLTPLPPHCNGGFIASSRNLPENPCNFLNDHAGGRTEIVRRDGELLRALLFECSVSLDVKQLTSIQDPSGQNLSAEGENAWLARGSGALPGTSNSLR